MFANGASAAGQSTSWVKVTNGNIPPGTVQVGNEPGGTLLFHCRVGVSNSVMQLGKMLFGVCNYPVGSVEGSSKSYEVFVGAPKWAGALTANAAAARDAVAGADVDGSPLVPCRGKDIRVPNTIQVGKFNVRTGKCVYSAGGRAETALSYDVSVA